MAKFQFIRIIDFYSVFALYSRRYRGVAQLAAHRVWDAGVGGSSPPTPTKQLRGRSFFVDSSPVKG